MRWLQQISEPKEVSDYKKDRKQLQLEQDYSDLPKKELRKNLVLNQGGLCAYCMSRIHCDDGRISDNGYIHIEHIIPESEPVISKGYNSNTDVKNMLGVCAGNRMDSDDEKKYCDASRGGEKISFSPYNKLQMDTISYLRDGTICSTDTEIDRDLNVLLHLNSNSNSLKKNRETSYRKLRDLVQSMSNRKTVKQTQLKRLRQLFCERDADGIYNEYVGVYEYWLDKWERKA